METRDDSSAYFHTIPLFGKLDSIVIILLLAALGFSFPLLNSFSSTTVRIFVDNRFVAEYPLNHNLAFKVSGATGPVDVAIRENSVAITSAHCLKQICVHTGPISKPWQQIVCVPNHLLIYLNKTDRTIDVDATAR